MAELSSFQFIPLATFDTSSMLGTYQALNGAGFGDDIKWLKIYNGGTQGITVSYDGVNDHDFLPPGATEVRDIQSNHQGSSSFGSGTLYGKKNQILYGKGVAGAGLVYIIGMR